MSVLVGIGDLHCPYIDPLAVQAAVDVVKKVQPDVIVQVGDAYEFDNGSNWRASHERERPSEEFRRGKDTLVEIWAELARVAPKAERYMIWGNHDERLIKRAFEKLPDAASMVYDAVKKMMQIPGVDLVDHEMFHVGKFGGEAWAVTHGFSKPGEHATRYACNIMCGHLHKGYVVTVPGGYIELNTAWLGDMDHHSKHYAKARRQNWNHGLAVVDDLGPRFVRVNR